MPLTKRDAACIERRLIISLIEACETAKSEITGFDWLTHTVDHSALPKSLRLTVKRTANASTVETGAYVWPGTDAGSIYQDKRIPISNARVSNPNSA
ncbi:MULTISPECIES: hypothetical protein [Pseudomonas]|uniref:hypothetical protein n=1 Tax=Pseudomonas TaxID=286 RepID=UPI000FEFA269|nr:MULTISPECIES: hypothetical protein [Pseudomonas]